ncbi:MAG: aminotransferase class V-fold PLP-dependent enzyme [Desulfomonilaceae bacterium]
MPFDLTRARAETPGCSNVLHFNNAGASLMPEPVLDSVIGHLRLEAEIGGYEAAEQAGQEIEHVYDSAARLISCRPDEIAVVENATRGWDMAFYSIPFRAGDIILTSVAEYASNFIAYLQVAHRTDATVKVIPNDEYGAISVDALKNSIDNRVKLIALTHVPTNGGLVNPAEKVGEIAREAGVLYLLDACQSVGQMPINVQRIGCDMLAATGRKFLRGPRGTGFLFVRREILESLEPPLLDLHAARWVEKDRYEIREDARRFENWETNCAGKIGLGTAIDYTLQWRLEETWSRISHLGEQLRGRLAELPGVIVRDLGREKCGIVTFTVEGKNPEEIRLALSEKRINVSVSPSQYTLLDMENRGLKDGVIRASVHYYNTDEEIDRFYRVLEELL